MERRRGSGMEPGRAAEGRTLDRDRRDGRSGGHSKGRGGAGGRGIDPEGTDGSLACWPGQCF